MGMFISNWFWGSMVYQIGVCKMKKFKIITKEEKVIDSVICDRCNKEFSDVVELQEFLFIKRFCGFGSIF